MFYRLKPFLTAALLSIISTNEIFGETMHNFTVGSKAPELELVLANGESICIATFLEKNRLVLLFVPTEFESQAEGYLLNFKRQQKALQERDLRIFAIVERGATIQKKDFGPNIIVSTSPESIAQGASRNGDSSPLFILIGKDRTVKLREPKFVGDKALFNTVDAMPMRQSEMRRNRH